MCLNLVPGGKSPATRWAQTSDGAKKLKEHGKWLGETFGKEMFTTEHQKKAAKAMAQKYADGFESRLKGRVYEDEEHKRLYPKATCPECGLTGNARQIKQWHGLDGKKCKAKREGNQRFLSNATVQHLTALSIDETTAHLVNLDPTECDATSVPGDIYMFIADRVWDHLTEMDKEISQESKDEMQRLVDEARELKLRYNPTKHTQHLSLIHI